MRNYSNLLTTQSVEAQGKEKKTTAYLAGGGTRGSAGLPPLDTSLLIDSEGC